MKNRRSTVSAQGNADQGNAGGVGLKGALDVPFPVQFGQALVDGGGVGGEAGHVLFGLAADLLVDMACGVLGHPFDGRGDHDKPSERKSVLARIWANQSKQANRMPFVDRLAGNCKNEEPRQHGANRTGGQVMGGKKVPGWLSTLLSGGALNASRQGSG